MIVSHRHKFIFVKTGKTAGTSIEVALNGLCGPEDVCTPLGKRLTGRSSREGEEGLAPRNFMGRFVPHLRLDAPWAVTKREIKDALRGRKFFNHMPAEYIRARVGKTVWDGYFKFCFERNPWDKTVSAYHWESARNDLNEDFETWLERRGAPSQVERYSVDGEIAVDFIGKFEELEADFHKALAQIGIAERPALGRAKTGYRQTRSYREYYTERTREIVARTCAREIELFGYEF